MDDFVTVGKPGSEECASNLKIMHETCSNSGTTVEEDKSEGPATVLPFLGIKFDIMKMELRGKLEASARDCGSVEGQENLQEGVAIHNW